MADPAGPCQCTPFQNICCCGAINGITVTQPACQTLPDGSVVNNPAFVASLGKSFWTYKFFTDCTQTTQAISNLGIPVCGVLNSINLVVSEKIDGCGDFVSVPFTLTANDPNLGPAPSGFQWVKVETSGRYDKGVSVEYRLEILGDYPIAVEPIEVTTTTEVITFDCGCFQVPLCPPQGQLQVTKNCGHTIINNQATLNYSVEVANIGNGTLTNVQYLDTIVVPIRLSLGTITVTPPTLSVDTTTPGFVKISGNLGTIAPGGIVPITYSIPIAAVTEPGEYLITNTANASASGTQSSATCTTNLDVVKLTAAKCCSGTTGNRVVFTLTIGSVSPSPSVIVNILDHLTIPTGVTVQFADFAGCSAVFSGTVTPVPTNTPITGPVEIDIHCGNVLVPSGGVYVKVGTLFVLGSTVVGSSSIVNTITDVVPVDPSAQVFLGVSPIPVSAQINVDLSVVCQSPC